jgi:hypothetical protein
MPKRRRLRLVRQPAAAAYGKLLEIATPMGPLDYALSKKFLKLSKIAKSLPASSPKRGQIMKRIDVLESYCTLGGLSDWMMDSLSKKVLEPYGFRITIRGRRGRRVEYRHQVLLALESKLGNPEASWEQICAAYPVPNLQRQIIFLKALLKRENIPLPDAEEYLLTAPITE